MPYWKQEGLELLPCFYRKMSKSTSEKCVEQELKKLHTSWSKGHYEISRTLPAERDWYF